MINENDIVFMRRAFELAKSAGELGEVPVGALVVCDGIIAGEGMNLRESGKNALYHAEISAIDKACGTLGGWRLHKCTLYVTLEPCIMCAGAIVNSRIKRVVYGASDKRFGAFGSILDVNSVGFNHKPEVEGGVLEEECSLLMKNFFSELRRKN